MFLELSDITKLYDKANGIRNISFSVEHGEFVTLLGPSGCGKTTTLNIIEDSSSRTVAKLSLMDRTLQKLYRKKDRIYCFPELCAFSAYECT